MPAISDLLPPAVDGLACTPRLLAADAQAALIARLATLDFAPFQFHQWQGKRRVAWFGLRYDYGESGLTTAPAIPDFLLPVRAAAAAFAGLPAGDFVQSLVTEYAPGAGIGWHRDRPVFGQVIGVSLASACTLRLRRRTAGGFERAALHLAPGSAYLLAGEARHAWEHSIAPVEVLRYSVTFRTLAAPR